MQDLVAILDNLASLTDKKIELRVIVADLAGLHPGTQMWLARQTDLLICVHGNALTWGILMKSGSVMIEMMPIMNSHNLHACKTGRNKNPVSLLGGLARLRRIHHICVNVHAVVNDKAKGGMWTKNNVLVDHEALRPLAEAFEILKSINIHR